MKNMFKMFAVAVIFLMPFGTHAEPKVDLLPGMSDQLFVNEGIMNPIKLFKVNDKFYFFNLGSQQRGIFLDIYDPSMKLLKHIKIGEYTNKEIKIIYNKDKKNFGILWRDGIPGLLYYRFLDIDGNLLTDSVQLGLDSKIGEDLITSSKSPDWAHDKDGNYLALWIGRKSDDPRIFNSCIFAQRINKDFKLDGPSFSLNDCNVQTVAHMSKVFSFQDKYFIYEAFIEDYDKPTRKIKSYYNILKNNFTDANSSPWRVINTEFKDLQINSVLADQSGVYFLLAGNSEGSDKLLTIKLIKLNLATEKFSDVYTIGTSQNFNGMPILTNDKIYLTARWANIYDESSTNYQERAKTFFIAFDLKTNKAKWTMLLDQPSLNGYQIELEDIDNSKLYFYRSYRESTHSVPVYGYLTTIDENLLVNSRSPLITFQTSTPETIDKNLITKLSGKILLQIESRGEAWYVNPKNGKRYYMANGDEAYNIMRNLSIGINNANFNKLVANKAFAKSQAGKIFIKTEDLGKAYYIDFAGTAHYLKDGSDAYNIMRKLGLGIKNSDLNKIEISK